ncbi:signal peptidase I [Streptomyces sp. NPDC051776]|uniref:signal peptidase I n=1 Tax=Streptomyces sp. NPDC051776 TaxID=3155414 RepID=UPI00342AEA91
MSAAARTRRTSDGHGRLGSMLSGLAVTVGCVLFLGGFVLGAILYQPYTVPTDSMEPTVDTGARVLAQRIDGGDVRRGDVVVFKDELWGDLPMVKRVVGVGGDKIACCDKQGRLTVNGKPVAESYLPKGEPASPSDFDTAVPKGHLFLLGDHRSTSQDSRVHLADGDHGSVPRGAVSARVEATAWPLAGFGMLAQATPFEDLPGGISEPGPLRPIFVAVVAGAVLILGGAAYGPLSRRSGRGRKGRARVRTA